MWLFPGLGPEAGLEHQDTYNVATMKKRNKRRLSTIVDLKKRQVDGHRRESRVGSQSPPREGTLLASDEEPIDDHTCLLDGLIKAAKIPE